MVKGGKRYSSMSNDGKWFAHSDSTGKESQSRETSTSTGIMLTQVKSSLPQALEFRRYPKYEPQKEPRDYPFSSHDNKQAFKDNIFVFTHGVGRRKCLDGLSQHNSHFCLCPDGADSGSGEKRANFTIHQTDYQVMQADNVPTSNRRFPRNHLQKSAEAALAQAGEHFMWFAQL
ncbi:testis-expressed protein 36 [Sphaeramia orbicularis]|uniref:testis-expressed protein 36 n=1 Tax=Sphaeramia orbicularis TaxID=375764 RepID=UPI00117BF819|nr:testis-expressed protein 36 [Sphaeramia orbicularis]